MYAHHSASIKRETAGALHSNLCARTSLKSPCQTAAETMQEQERISNEEAEKRLKAALTAKKPLNSVSRVASPGIGAPATDVSTDAKSGQDTVSKDDVAEPHSTSVPTVPEV